MKKTKKSVAKRIKLTKKGKMLRRKMGIDHFRTRQKSKVLRHKRSKHAVKSMDARVLKKYLPHHSHISEVGANPSEQPEE